MNEDGVRYPGNAGARRLRRATGARAGTTPLGLLSCAITAEVGASLAMQAAVEHPWWYLVVVLGYGVGFVLLVRILKSGTAVGVAYGIWAASGVALTALCAALLFGHTLSGTSVGGIALIVVGVVLVEWGAQAGHRRIGQEL